MAKNLKHEVIYLPGYDKRSSEPGNNYGIHGGSMQFCVIGEHGAVYFLMYCGFYPETAKRHLAVCNPHPFDAIKSLDPYGVEIGYHSHIQMHDYDSYRESCNVLDGKPCYSSCEGLIATKWLKAFLSEGTKWLWPELEDYYRTTFERKKQ